MFIMLKQTVDRKRVRPQALAHRHLTHWNHSISWVEIEKSRLFQGL